jgi:hypothetical protein
MRRNNGRYYSMLSKSFEFGNTDASIHLEFSDCEFLVIIFANYALFDLAVHIQVDRTSPSSHAPTTRIIGLLSPDIGAYRNEFVQRSPILK